ncbi:lytic transglycosylase domain-containing protein [Profundibacterium mesophilum]|uniref:Soluble lytic transglycosylase n=1 Tax=Profundibacterium mesophilum KAUST100406-0324 TaxID=1037889 RepID=A0A921P169_9RHOB|nr:lytic transglycosylase domain-containing protein [Profundibacterium mesophilum]KAF0677303.1 Soluble lytic transglycosylase [Profundibacterium mesophilum KAUST100406-0324]
MPVYFITMKWLPLLLLTCAPAFAAGVQGMPAAEPVPHQSRPSMGLADAMTQLRRGNWSGALEAAARHGPVGRDIIEWHRLRAGLGTFDEALSFSRRRADWPGMPYLRQRSEKAVPLEGRAPDVIDFFSSNAPTTGNGALALSMAFSQIGAQGDAEAQAALAWLELPMDAETERMLLARYGRALEGLHEARLDALLWEGAPAAARRAMTRVGAGWQALAEARLLLRTMGEGIDAAIAAVPEALADDAGLAYERFRWRMAKGRRDSAIELLAARSSSAEELGRPELWARARRDLARAEMRGGDPERAYAIAASHWLTEGSDFADLEWLSGYLALTYLDQPQRAVEHFKRFRSRVETPISLGRAGYWEGRAQEAAGNMEAARNAYAFGAEFQTSFYGLLAAERAELPLDPLLTGAESFPPLSEASFRDSAALEAGLLLQAAGERALAERFFITIGETLPRAELGTLADLALRLGEPHLGLMIAKEAARQGHEIAKAYYPVVDLGVEDMPVARELALAIARRESEFDPGVSSGVGASGLMQLMPGTAQDVARLLGLPYSKERLFSDPSYNATLGSAYLAGLINRFGNNPILVAAGYNAGPGRPMRWMKERGDPRGARVDMIDWIEHIPFDETRNYVMRVAESLPVYRARLEGRVRPLDFSAEIAGR